MTRSVRAIRINQNDRIFYVTSIPASELLAVVDVDVWHAGGEGEDAGGYQRAPSQARKNQIANYMSQKDAVLPVGGLLNARPPQEDKSSYGSVLKFKADDGEMGNIVTGTLTLPDTSHPLWVVDMQHRLGGLATAISRGEDVSDFPVVVTIADGLSKMEEVEQFELINTTQKKVRTDLARRLLAIRATDKEHQVLLDQEGRMWEAKGPRIVDWLNKNCSVWAGRIMEPNASKKHRPNSVARETSFVTSLKPVLTTPLLSRAPEDQVGELLASYWEVLAEFWKDAFSEPKNYVIQKTNGYFPLHMIAPDVFELARQESDLSKGTLRNVLQPLSEIETDYWHRDGTAAQFGGMKGFGILAGELRSYLPAIDLSLS